MIKNGDTVTINANHGPAKQGVVIAKRDVNSALIGVSFGAGITHYYEPSELTPEKA